MTRQKLHFDAKIVLHIIDSNKLYCGSFEHAIETLATTDNSGHIITPEKEGETQKFGELVKIDVGPKMGP
jgi:hypothetical protein